MNHIAISICTCRRPKSLRRLLFALADLEWNEDLRVYVVDNDLLEEGILVCKEIASSYRWDLKFAAEPQKGISFARNRAIEMALADNAALIAIIDDDEWPAPHWLRELVRVLEENNADAVGGPAIPVFPEKKDAWWKPVSHCFGSNQALDDGKPCILHSTGNVLIRASSLERYRPIFFRPDYALSGGEDYLFFRDLSRHGSLMNWASNAIVYEPVTDSRLTLDWIRKRMILKGNLQVRIFREHAPHPHQELGRICKTSALIFTGISKYLVGIIYPTYKLKGLTLLWRAQGKVYAHLGRVLNRVDEIEGF